MTKRKATTKVAKSAKVAAPKIGRPLSLDAGFERRDRTIRFRATAEEEATYTAKAKEAGQDLSTWIRMRLDGAEFLSDAEVAALDAAPVVAILK